MTIKTYAKIALVVFSTAAMALPPEPDAEAPPSHRLERLTQELQLTPEQVTKVDAVLKEQHEKFKAIHEESSTRLKAILSPEQVTKWEKMKEDFKDKRRGRRKMR